MIYFKEKEVEGLDKELISMLDIARSFAEIPFIITSGFRTPEKNQQVGGAKDSAHLKGLAVDLACCSSEKRYLIIKGLIKAGFKRIEICKHHIHADIDRTKKQEIIFLESEA